MTSWTKDARCRRPTTWLLSVIVAISPNAAAYGQASWDVENVAGGADRTLATRNEVASVRARRQAAADALQSERPLRDAAHERLIRDGRTLYRMRRSGLLPLAGGLSAMIAHASRVGRLERVVHGDLAALSACDKRTSTLTAQVAELDANVAKAERDVALIEASRAAAERRALSAALETRAPQALPVQASLPRERMSYGLSVVSGPIAERFPEQRGHLALPVSGPSRIEEATRSESDGAGLELTTQHGASVRAAASGRVAFAEDYGSYGQLVVLEHGDRYFTAYGGLATIEVQVGDEVSKSARLGSAGSDPVYFEVRRGTRAQNARSWLGL